MGLEWLCGCISVSVLEEGGNIVLREVDSPIDSMIPVVSGGYCCSHLFLIPEYWDLRAKWRSPSRYLADMWSGPVQFWAILLKQFVHFSTGSVISKWICGAVYGMER